MAMKATLILCDAAVSHDDGTFSLLRGGITAVWGERPPYELRAALVVRIEGDIGDAGAHTFNLRFVDQDGKPQGPELAGNFELPHGGGNATLVLNFNTKFSIEAPYVFILHVDRSELDRWTIRAMKRPPQQEAPKKP